METNSYKLLDFVGSTSGHTGKIAAVYTQALGSNVQAFKDTVFMFYTKEGKIQFGYTQLVQGRIPLVKMGPEKSFDESRSFAQRLLSDGYSLNKAWMK